MEVEFVHRAVSVGIDGGVRLFPVSRYACGPSDHIPVIDEEVSVQISGPELADFVLAGKWRCCEARVHKCRIRNR